MIFFLGNIEKLRLLEIRSDICYLLEIAVTAQLIVFSGF